MKLITQLSICMVLLCSTNTSCAGEIYRCTDSEGIPSYHNKKINTECILIAKSESNTEKQYQAGMNSFLQGDRSNTLKMWMPLAEQGDRRAQFGIGTFYYSGKGILQDYKLAMFWYLKSAEQGDRESQLMLGQMFRIGEGASKDEKQAFYWYLKAAEQGEATAQFVIGSMYFDGKVVAQDYKQSAIWFRKSAEQGNIGAQALLGSMYRNGNGVPQDYVKAHMWTNLAAAGAIGDIATTHAALRNDIANKMTQSQIALAQEMAGACQKSNYKKCDW